MVVGSGRGAVMTKWTSGWLCLDDLTQAHLNVGHPMRFTVLSCTEPR